MPIIPGMAGTWDAWSRPEGGDVRSGDQPGPPKGVLGWLRRLVGWPGAARAHDTPAEKALVIERARSGPPGTIFPWFLPYFDEGQTLHETATMRLAYRKMLADPNVKSAVLGKLLAVANLTLKVIPQDRKNKSQADDAEFVRWNLEDALEGGVPGMIWAVFSGALIDGYSVCEKVWAREERGKYKGSYYLRALKPKDTGNDVIFLTDEFRNIVGIRGMRYNSGVTFSPSNFVIYRHLPLYDQATGMSDFRAVYSRYWMLDTVQKLRAVCLEKRSLPVIVGHYTHAQDRPAVEEALSLVKSQNWLAVPESVRVEALSIAGAAATEFGEACRQLAEDIFLGIAGATLQARQGDVNNARGSSQVHRNTADLFIWHLSVCAQSILNDRRNGIVRDIIDLNRVVEEYPKAQLSAVDEQDLVGELQVDRGLWEIGVKQSLSALYDRYNREPPDANDPDDSLGGKADQEAQVAATTLAAPGGPAGAAASDMVLTDDTRANAGTREVSAPMPGLKPALEGRMAEGDQPDEESREVKYPLAHRDNWHGDSNYKSTGGRMVYMHPDEFLSMARPLKIDDVAQENIDDLANHISGGGELDPLAIYRGGKEDGRHRAHAAKKLGIKKVPVLLWDDVETHAEPKSLIARARHFARVDDATGIDAPISDGAGVDSIGRRYAVSRGKRISLKRPRPRAEEYDELDRTRHAPPPRPQPAPEGTVVAPVGVDPPRPEEHRRDSDHLHGAVEPLGGFGGSGGFFDLGPEPAGLTHAPPGAGTADPAAAPPHRYEHAPPALRYAADTMPAADKEHLRGLGHEELSQAQFVPKVAVEHSLNKKLIGDVIVGGKVAFYKGQGGSIARNEESLHALNEAAGLVSPFSRRVNIEGAPEQYHGSGGMLQQNIPGQNVGEMLPETSWADARAAWPHIEKNLKPGEVDRNILAAFLAGTNDRHLGNFMVSGNRLVPVDHEFAYWDTRPQRGAGPLDPEQIRQNALAELRAGEPTGRDFGRRLVFDPEVTRDLADRATHMARIAEERRPGAGRWVRLHGQALREMADSGDTSFDHLSRILLRMRKQVTGRDDPGHAWWED